MTVALVGAHPSGPGSFAAQKTRLTGVQTDREGNGTSACVRVPCVPCVVQGALQRILIQGDVPAAVSFVEGEITRLLTGHVGVWELAMTGGLWRVTGQQLERAAAAAAGEAPHSPRLPALQA